MSPEHPANDVHAAGSTAPDQSGDPRALPRMQHQSAERLSIEEALRVSEERYATAQRVANVGTWDRDLVSGRLNWSEQIEPMFGLERGQFDGTYECFTRCVHPEDRAKVAALTKRAMEENTDYVVEHRVVWPDGTVRWVAEHGAVQRDASGRPVRMLGVVQDVTRRRNAEEDRTRLAAAVEQAAEGILVADGAGIVHYVNPALAHILGSSRESLLGKPATDFSGTVTPEMLALARERPESVGEVGSRFSPPRPDGTVCEVEETLTPLRSPEGSVTGFLSIWRDITEQLGLEDQLRQAQKMQAIGQLAGGVAHDFNNLLQAILGNLQLARDDVGPGHAALVPLEEAQQASRRAVELVRQLLVFGRRERLQPQDVDLNRQLEELVRMVRRVIGEHLELVLRLDPRARPVQADPGRVQQVVMNLCVNARDAMPEGGRITLTTRDHTFDSTFCQTHPWAQPGAYTRLSVEDTGTGMSEAVQSRMFEPFFTTKEVGRGTGLGLATVYGIVKEHDGLITFESKPGRGSAFHVYLPVAETPAPAGTPPTPLAPTGPGHGETLLLVEDEEAVRRLVLRVLEKAGYHVLAAADGDEGVRVFEANPDVIRLAVVDLVMPKRSGRAVAEALHALRPGLPILFATGYDRDNLAEGFRPEARTELIQKPYAAGELLAKIRQMLGESGP